MQSLGLDLEKDLDFRVNLKVYMFALEVQQLVQNAYKKYGKSSGSLQRKQRQKMSRESAGAGAGANGSGATTTYDIESAFLSLVEQYNLPREGKDKNMPEKIREALSRKYISEGLHKALEKARRFEGSSCNEIIADFAPFVKFIQAGGTVMADGNAYSEQDKSRLILLYTAQMRDALRKGDGQGMQLLHALTDAPPDVSQIKELPPPPLYMTNFPVALSLLPTTNDSTSIITTATSTTTTTTTATAATSTNGGSGGGGGSVGVGTTITAESSLRRLNILANRLSSLIELSTSFVPPKEDIRDFFKKKMDSGNGKRAEEQWAWG